MKRLLLLSILSLFMMTSSVLGLTSYGNAQILKGSLIIVRDGQAKKYTTAHGDVEVLSGDVLRAGKNSRVVLMTVEDTSIRMGSHAVFQVKPWKKRKKTGYARMVYGKIRFKTKQVQSKRRFRLKTATATIGVKGTEGDVEVGSTGNTSCVGAEGVIAFQGNSGESTDLAPNQLAMAVGNKPVADPVDLPPAEQPADDEQVEDQEMDDLDKAPPTSEESASLGTEEVALETGLVDQSDLDESKQEEVSADISLEEEIQQEEQDQVIDEQEEIEQDSEFDQDLEASEENIEVAAVEPDVPADAPEMDPDAMDDGEEPGQEEEPTEELPAEETPEQDIPVDETPDMPDVPDVEPEIDPDSLKGIGRMKPVFNS